MTERSDSLWSSAAVLVRKKDGTWRSYVDHWEKNDMIVKYSYSLPKNDDTLGAMAGAKRFFILDPKSSYHRVEIAEEEKPKTTFTFDQDL